jgi:hypothetical protein
MVNPHLVKKIENNYNVIEEFIYFQIKFMIPFKTRKLQNIILEIKTVLNQIKYLKLLKVVFSF